MNFHAVEDAMKLINFDCNNPDDVPILHDKLLTKGLRKWWPSDPVEGKITGAAIFNSFERTFEVLINGPPIKSVTFQNPWYTNWSWITAKNLDDNFFGQMDEKLNDDCICEIIKRLDILHCLYFATINKRFRDIALGAEVSRNLCIFQSSVGQIGLMNFRYLLQTFGSSIINLSVSLLSFRFYLGFAFPSVKRDILDIIYVCTGPKLKTLILYDFELNQEEESNKSILQMFFERGIEVKFMST